MRITAKEKAAYHPDVDVYWQPKAWADGGFYNQYIERTLKPAFAHLGGEVLLFCDNLACQTTPEFRQKVRSIANARVWNYPANVTDLLQPIDAGLGRCLKLETGVELADWLDHDDNLEKYENNQLTASDRRVLMTRWVGAAHARLLPQWQNRHSAFARTGSLLTADGSLDNLVLPQGTMEYKFDHIVKDWPDEKAEGEEEADEEEKKDEEKKEEKKEEKQNAEGKEEKKDGAEKDDYEEEDEDEGDMEVCDSDDDDAADESDDENAQCFTRLATAVPEGWKVVPECPTIDKSLARRRMKIVFRFRLTGWCPGHITKFYNKPRGGDNNFNAEIRTDGDLQDTWLRENLYGGTGPSAWYVLTKAE